MPVKSLNEHQATVLILEMLNCRVAQDHPERIVTDPEAFKIFHPIIFDYALELANLGMGTLSGDAKSGAIFTPSDAATQWLIAQPLAERETYLLTHAVGGDFGALMPNERDPEVGYPEFVLAAFTLSVRNFGTFVSASSIYNSSSDQAVGDKYFEISDAGREHITSSQS